MITLATIQDAVAQYYKIPVETMRLPAGPGKSRHLIAHPRQVAMYLATELTDHSLTTIGKHFGRRDHTTVLYARRQVEKRRAKLGPTRVAVHRLVPALQLASAAEFGCEPR